MLRGVLANQLPADFDKQRLESSMAKLGIPATARAEEVSVAQWVNLHELLR